MRVNYYKRNGSAFEVLLIRHRLVHRPHMVGADLVPESARTAVDHHADLPLAQAHRPRHALVVDGIDGLHLQEVVARAQAADLPEAAFHGSRTHPLTPRPLLQNSLLIWAFFRMSVIEELKRDRCGGDSFKIQMAILFPPFF